MKSPVAQKKCFFLLCIFFFSFSISVYSQKSWSVKLDYSKAFIENKKLFGDIANEPRFMTPYLSALASLHEVGAQETLKGILK